MQRRKGWERKVSRDGSDIEPRGGGWRWQGRKGRRDGRVVKDEELLIDGMGRIGLGDGLVGEEREEGMEGMGMWREDVGVVKEGEGVWRRW